ncbi:Cytochrome c6, chloroplastic [Ananas comosus]|uniref:Cytochrome c-553 n=1 Tax=Ananas comosus TaxID=4615 RepID=A0A199VF02_ANACO|nr:Cytochrome c6, chloroplastic [Ananas comosus]
MSPTLFAAESLSQQPISSGARLFQKACIGCHDMGGNILQPVSLLLTPTISYAKREDSILQLLLLLNLLLIPQNLPQDATLFMNTHCSLQSKRPFVNVNMNGVSTEEEIYNITYYGKGWMPGFGEKCAPRGQCTFGPRLQEEEIKLLAELVKSQADRGWPNIESHGD